MTFHDRILLQISIPLQNELSLTEYRLYILPLINQAPQYSDYLSIQTKISFLSSPKYFSYCVLESTSLNSSPKCLIPGVSLFQNLTFFIKFLLITLEELNPPMLNFVSFKSYNNLTFYALGLYITT